jgi:hypothetical protein
LVAFNTRVTDQVAETFEVPFGIISSSSGSICQIWLSVPITRLDWEICPKSSICIRARYIAAARASDCRCILAEDAASPITEREVAVSTVRLNKTSIKEKPLATTLFVTKVSSGKLI